MSQFTIYVAGRQASPSGLGVSYRDRALLFDLLDVHLVFAVVAIEVVFPLRIVHVENRTVIGVRIHHEGDFLANVFTAAIRASVFHF